MNHMKKSIHILSFYILVIVLFLFGTFLGNETVSVIAEKFPVERKNRIVIDAGHGGEDGGAISCTGRSESGYNLQIALRLDDLLHLLGYETRMIRSTDTSVYTGGKTILQKKVSDLKERVRITNSTPNATLISIHQNDFSDSRYSGPQVFYAANNKSEILASQMQEALIGGLAPNNNRKIKKGSGIYLLEKAEVPAILVECGFLSNSREECLLRSPDYQKKICCILSGVLSRYLAST